MNVAVGDAVTLHVIDRGTHEQSSALVTALVDYLSEWPTVNLVAVSGHTDQLDPYGRRVMRYVQVPHECRKPDQTSHTYYTI